VRRCDHCGEVLHDLATGRFCSYACAARALTPKTAIEETPKRSPKLSELYDIFNRVQAMTHTPKQTPK